MQQAKGLSLTELLVTLALAAIVLAYALGNFTQLVARSRQTSAINNLVTSMLLARSHAITKHEYVLLCPSDDGASCANSRDWRPGWLARAAATEAEVLNPYAEHEILRVQGASTALVIAANRDFFLFRPHARRATNGTLEFCHERVTIPGKAVILSYTGRPRLARYRADGRAVSCDTDHF